MGARGAAGQALQPSGQCTPPRLPLAVDVQPSKKLKALQRKAQAAAGRIVTVISKTGRKFQSYARASAAARADRVHRGRSVTKEQALQRYGIQILHDDKALNETLANVRRPHGVTAKNGAWLPDAMAIATAAAAVDPSENEATICSTVISTLLKLMMAVAVRTQTPVSSEAVIRVGRCARTCALCACAAG
jgi:hypothetical protein